MPIDPSLIVQWDQMPKKLESFLQRYRPTDEQGQFHHIVTAIAGAAVRNYRILRDAYSEDHQVRVAWACRNLLELAVFAQFVIASEKNAKEFADDRLIDGHQIALLLFKMEEREAGTAHAQNSVGSLVDEYLNQMDAEHITRKRFNRVEDISQGELRQEFNDVNQLCSKFVHPTSWSLLTADKGPDRFPQASELMFSFGAKYFVTVCEAFMPHIRKHGLSPKPPQ